MPCCILSSATLDDMVLDDETPGNLYRRPSNESPKHVIVSLADVGESGFARYVKTIRAGVISNIDLELGLIPDEDILQREIYEQWRALKPEDKMAWFSNSQRPWTHGETLSL